MIQLNYKSGVPICDQIVNGFIRMKALGLVESGEQLPSVRQLAMELSVNPNTIQKAYQILESSGIIYSVKGKGSFFSDDAAADAAWNAAHFGGTKTIEITRDDVNVRATFFCDLIDTTTRNSLLG